MPGVWRCGGPIWSRLARVGKAWDAVAIGDFGTFLAAVRADDFDPVVRSIRPPLEARSESTVALRLRAVMGFYRYQAGLGVDAAPFLYEQVRARTAGRYKRQTRRTDWSWSEQ